MPRSKRIVAVALASLLVAAGTAGIVLASSGSDGGDETASASAARFSPSKIKGKWTGQWTNTTFNSSGSIRANIRVRPGGSGPRIVLLIDFGGDVFGCPDPAAAVQSLRKGRGPNTWNAKGFRVRNTSQAFGKVNITYNFATKVLRGSGSAPPCNPSITYTLRGKLFPKRLSATVQIDLGSQTATAKLTAKKN